MTTKINRPTRNPHIGYLAIMAVVGLVTIASILGLFYYHQEYQDASIRLAEAQYQNGEVRIMLDTERATTADLRQQLADQRFLFDEQQAKLEHSLATIRSLEDQKRVMTAELQEQQRQTSVLADQKRSLDQQIKDANRQLQEAQSTIQSLRQEVASQAAMLQAQWDQQTSFVGERDGWSSEKAALQQQIANLTQQRDSVMAAYEERNETVNSLSNTLRQVEQDTRTLQAQVQADPGCMDGNQNYGPNFLDILSLLLMFF